LQSPSNSYSDKRRPLYFGRVILSFSPIQIFRDPWADFREPLPYDAVHPEILYLVWVLMCASWNISGAKTPFFADVRIQNLHFEPRHSLMREKSGNLKTGSISGYVRTSVPNVVGIPLETSLETGCYLCVWVWGK